MGCLERILLTALLLASCRGERHRFPSRDPTAAVCPACTKCTHCKHCAKERGECSVCRGKLKLRRGSGK